MKFNTKIPQSLKPFYLKELQEAEICLTNNNLSKSWLHLENAHVLGQPYPFQHTYVHWKMLQFGFKIKNTKTPFGFRSPGAKTFPHALFWLAIGKPKKG